MQCIPNSATLLTLYIEVYTAGVGAQIPKMALSSSINCKLPTVSTGRQLLLYLTLVALLLTIVGFLWLDPIKTLKTSPFISAVLTDNMRSKIPECSSMCAPDPFNRPGTLLLGANPSDTRWIPFPPQMSMTHFNSANIDYHAPVPQDALELASPQYMRMLSNGTSGMDWVKNKTVLFIGSSHDR